MEMESPECPVCLQNYDGDTVIPRVLACGHTACEGCLLNLPQRYSHTIRCPECNQLVNYPSQGPTALPKNIDLLRLTGNSHKPDKTPPNYDPCHSQSHHFLPQFWSHEFFSLWKQWVLPNDAVLIEGDGEEAEMIRVGLYENQRVSVFRLVSLHDDAHDSSVFRYSYVVKVMNCLSGMREEEREELGLILRAQEKFVCKVFGLWGDLEGGFLSLVCERQNGSLLEKFGDLGDRFCGEDEEGLSKDGISGFAMIGAGICEAVIALHFEGLVIGCLDLSCFSFDDFGRVCVDLSAVLVAGRKLRKHVVEAVSGKLRIDDNEMGVIFSGLLKNEAFLSPQLLLELLQKEGISVECGSSRCSDDCNSDVWSLACVLMRLIIGKTFTEETLEICAEKGSDYSTLYMGWVEKVRSLLESNLGSEYASLSQILCKCLNFDQGSCPLATDVWRCIRELLIKPKFDITGGFEREIKENNTYHCLIFGKLCQLPTESAEIQEEDGADFDQVDKRVDKSFVEGLSEGVIKCKDLQGHLDCITELAVGGGFLFSSSFDKTVQVWSLQDFSHVHTFRGHEHRVTALVYVDEEQLCISGDNSGGIFVWAIRVPFGQDPVKKWYEEKDWRYSGIHALTISGNGYLYTGSGDKSIKAWSLKDGALYCTMNGHKSVVSTLAVCDGVLYSGGWDGTIRLWSLNDHSALAVLGEDMPGNVTSVLSLTADGDILIASFENGCIKVWRNDVLMKSMKLHQGAIFTTGMEGKWLFTGGWDKILKVQELLDDEFQIDITPTGSIHCGSVITALLCWQGKLIVGYADRSIKVYFYGK